MEAAITRRMFGKRVLLVAGGLIAFPLVEGFSCNSGLQTKLVQLIAMVGTGLEEVLPKLTGISATLLAQINTAFSTLQADVQAWVQGSNIANIEQAVNDFVAAMALIPVLGAYQPEVALIVAVVEGIITLLVPSPAPQTAAVRAMATKSAAQYPNPPQTAAAFASKFNSVAKANNLPVSIH
jgi:hypothetical protein